MTTFEQPHLSGLSDDPDDMYSLWVREGYVDPRMDAETKSTLRLIDYEMHLEDKAYTELFNHLVNDHGEHAWQLNGAETYALNGGPPFTLKSHHEKLHGDGAA